LFIEAWSRGNKYRLARLADAPSVDIVYSVYGDAPSGYTVSDSPAGDDTYVTVSPLPFGSQFAFFVFNAKLGHPHSMTAQA
jgi:hypothetical protein